MVRLTVVNAEREVASPPARAKRVDAAALALRSSFRLALVSMPWVSIAHPSIQIGLLKACVEPHGFAAETFHLNVDVAAAVGFSTYEMISSHRGTQLGEWLFAVAAFGQDAPDPDDRLLDDVPMVIDRFGADPARVHRDLRKLRRETLPALVDELAARVDWGRFAVVGFTSTFQQNVASFALAARIKARHPSVRIVMGGANFDGDMGRELLRAVPCIDYIVSGEGEDALPELLTALHEARSDREVAAIPGVAMRTDRGVTEARGRPLQRAMDDLPFPDYAEYFERIDAGKVFTGESRTLLEIPFESARGCWWGAKHHCTFCGLNGATMAFRSKSPERVAAELAHQSRRYGLSGFEAVDNIVDAAYLKTLFPALAAQEAGYSFFYEVKSNLTRDQIATLARGGVRRMQPGIESLSTRVLALMRKGVTALQNVTLLRWALHYGIDVGWNILWGFPGETARDYEAQLALVRKLAHLPPPGGGGRVWLERYSPLFADRAAFPARRVQPEASYAYVYPPAIDLEKVAYFFEYELEERLSDATYLELATALDVWRAAWNDGARPSLTYRASKGYAQIDDRRSPGTRHLHELTDLAADVHAACVDRPRGLAAILADVRAGSRAVSEGDVVRALADLGARDLVVADDGHFLSLALPARSGH